MKYRKLNQEQRYVLEALIDQGFSNRAMAEELGVHRTTIWRERQRHTTKRGPDKGYYQAGYSPAESSQERTGKASSHQVDPGTQRRHQILDGGRTLESAYWKAKGMAGVSTECIDRW